MFYRKTFFWLSLFLVVIILSCSTSKKGILNKEYHALTSKYNVIFNGKEAFSVGEEILLEAFEENFYDYIPVEPISLRGEDIDQTTIVPGFDRAEEKAVKAIQKHSINIKNIQYNREIEKAYLLLGKARYFDRRFFPALEAFNFLLETGASWSNFLDAKIWREKTNIRLKNYELAIENLRPLARKLISKNKYFSIANATVADAFMKLKKEDSTLYYIKRAAKNESKKMLKARYLFLTGQLFESIKEKDSAQWAYKQIIDLNRKAPRKFFVQALLKQNLLDTSLAYSYHIGSLEKMLKNYENDPYEHFIYRALAELYFKQKKDSIGLSYLEKSLESVSLDSYTKIENLKFLADHHLKKGNYVVSGGFLDKLLSIYEKSSTQYKRAKRKRENLNEVILYEKTAQNTDSIIKLALLNKDEQFTYFENFINLKRQKEIQKLKEAEESVNSQSINRLKTAFYFYNPNQLLKGRQTFLTVWGDRPNLDNWRSSEAILAPKEFAIQDKKKSDNFFVIQETPESYVSLVPSKKEEIDSLILLNQQSYLQLGMIYKEKFNDFDLAQNRLKKALNLNPPKGIASQALYHLYRMAEKDSILIAETYRINLLNNYPDTPFAILLTDPKNYDLSKIKTPELLYEKVLKLFEDQKFSETLKEIELLTVISSGSRIEPKINLLKAHTIGRLEGISSWKKALKSVASDYSAFEEGIEAKNLIDKIESLQNLDDNSVIYKNYKWIFPFESSNNKAIDTFYSQIKRETSIYNKSLSVSKDNYNEDYVFIVIHGIRDLNEIEVLKNRIEFDQEKLVNFDNFVTLASQYREYIKNKTWKTY